MVTANNEGFPTLEDLEAKFHNMRERESFEFRHAMRVYFGSVACGDRQGLEGNRAQFAAQCVCVLMAHFWEREGYE